MNKRENQYGARWYEIDGKEYPSVTTVLQILAKPALTAWSAKVERELVTTVSADLYQDTANTPRMSRAAYLLTLANRLGLEKAHQKELAKASEIGSQAHKLIEWTMRTQLMQKVGPSPRITDAAQWAFMAWEDWRKSVNLKPIWIEQTVWSEKHGYAGTLDLLAEVEGVLTVVDWKTGKAVYSEAHLQNAAYRQAIREMGHGDPKQGLIVRLPKVETDPNFEVVAAKPENLMFPKFLDAMSVWNWQQEMDAEYQAKKAAEQSKATPDAELEAKLCESIACSTKTQN
ncbi:MAG TPA: PD-(D/E)XK nuclease family protein [Terriglobales bacterium]|nr:PD-(D/E)XK nuclease family protein [Terriglobales bacterium]